MTVLTFCHRDIFHTDTCLSVKIPEMRVFPRVFLRKIMQFVTYHRKEKTQPARTLFEPLYEILPSGIYVEFTVICLFAGISLCHHSFGIILEFSAIGASFVQVCGIQMTVFAGHDLDLIFFHHIVSLFLAILYVFLLSDPFRY